VHGPVAFCIDLGCGPLQKQKNINIKEKEKKGIKTQPKTNRTKPEN
jgi:hypothetical protein